eukprot:gene6528-7199_t
MERSDELRIEDSLAKHINAWCGIHGLMYTDGKTNWYPAPISVIPSRFSREAFEYAQKIQPVWNKLMDRISRDRKFLLEELSTVGQADDFTERLIELYQKVPDDVLTSALQFGIFRSDYMLNHDNRLLQVEINTIAASFGCLSKKVRSLHDHLLGRFGHDQHFQDLIHKAFPDQPVTGAVLKANLQDNFSLENLSASLARAHKATSKGDEAIILFIVQPNERNQGDQRALEIQLSEKHHVNVEFVTLAEVMEYCQVEKDQTLSFARAGHSHRLPVSVVYFRAGYGPNDYPSQVEWDSRALLEGSNALKCPTVGYHLAGTKAIQAALCKPGVLERFLTEEESIILRHSFAEQYSLGDHDPAVHSLAEKAVQRAKEDGSNWVLKPQREGGGNNFYNDAVSNFLRAHDHHSTLSGYVLMERIFPRKAETIFYKQGEVTLAESISELGVYGAYLGYGYEGGDMLNFYCGYLLRTKGASVDEGGVATGYSVLNSISLIDE